MGNLGLKVKDGPFVPPLGVIGEPFAFCGVSGEVNSTGSSIACETGTIRDLVSELNSLMFRTVPRFAAFSVEFVAEFAGRGVESIMVTGVVVTPFKGDVITVMPGITGFVDGGSLGCGGRHIERGVVVNVESSMISNCERFFNL
jgi:hypothetical protein